MEIIYEECINHEWIVCDDKELKSRSNFSEIVWRSIWKFPWDEDDYIYRLGKKMHRLDGPAIEHYQNGILFHTLWKVNDTDLHSFEEYYEAMLAALVGNSIYEYIKKYPKFSKEILALVDYNGWPAEI